MKVSILTNPLNVKEEERLFLFIQYHGGLIDNTRYEVRQTFYHIIFNDKKQADWFGSAFADYKFKRKSAA